LTLITAVKKARLITPCFACSPAATAIWIGPPMFEAGSCAVTIFHSPLAVTTVMGNQTIEKVTRNALSVARVIGMDAVPIARGAHRPLVRTIETAPDIHGESGLDGPVLPEPAVALDPRHAVDLIIDTVMSHPPKTVSLVPTGALTNIALAVRKEPRLAERVKQVVLMGGGVHVGNWSAVAEFNIIIDPEAAHIVFNEPWPLTMIGLDATHQALATDEIAARIAAVGTAPARFVGELLEFNAENIDQYEYISF